MTTESLEDKLRNLHPKFKEAEAEHIASNVDAYTEMVRQISEVQAEMLNIPRFLPIPRELLDRFDSLAQKAWRVDELQNDN